MSSRLAIPRLVFGITASLVAHASIAGGAYAQQTPQTPPNPTDQSAPARLLPEPELGSDPPPSDGTAAASAPSASSSTPPTAAATSSLESAPSVAGEDLGALEALLGESVVTTASRSAERASTAPSTVYAITSEELRTFGIRSIDEALGYLGLGVYTSSARDYSTGIDVGAQGVLLRDAGKHMLALLDGHVMNSQVYGGVSINEAFGVPLETIDHIEVMLGAGSVVRLQCHAASRQCSHAPCSKLPRCARDQ
jgi:hypothetical protein